MLCVPTYLFMRYFILLRIILKIENDQNKSWHAVFSIKNVLFRISGLFAFGYR